jgi:formate dehydrogenase subunit gamma
MKLNDNDLIRKEPTFVIVNHWVLAISCILLTISGFGFLYQLELVAKFFGGFQLMRDIHNWLGVIFTLSLIVTIPTWLKECSTYDKDDIEWIKVAGGYLSHKVTIPPMYKLNTGQKFAYLGVLGMGIGIIATGVVIWLFPVNNTLMVLSHFIHNLCFVGIAIFIPVHVYLGAIANPGTMRIMMSGTVPVWWARKKSPKWVQEVEEGKSSH